MAHGIKKRKGIASEDKQKKAGGISLGRFIITYLGLMGVFFFLMGFIPFKRVLDLNGLYTQGIVMTTSAILNLISIPCTYYGSVIQLSSIALDIKFGCNGLEAVMIYSIAVVAFPSSWKNKLMGIFSGFIVIQVLNILRIVALAYSGVHFRSFFEYIHIYVAQGVMVAIALAIFAVYLHYAKTDEEAVS
jgi:exosortase/archaeosortase family protein